MSEIKMALGSGLRLAEVWDFQTDIKESWRMKMLPTPIFGPLDMLCISSHRSRLSTSRQRTKSSWWSPSPSGLSPLHSLYSCWLLPELHNSLLHMAYNSSRPRWSIGLPCNWRKSTRRFRTDVSPRSNSHSYWLQQSLHICRKRISDTPWPPPTNSSPSCS